MGHPGLLEGRTANPLAMGADFRWTGATSACRTRIIAKVKPHHHGLPLRVGTRASPLALVQTRDFLRC